MDTDIGDNIMGTDIGDNIMATDIGDNIMATDLGDNIIETNNGSKQGNIFENETKTEVKDMRNRINLLDLVAAESAESILEVVRVGSDETAIIPFTTDTTRVNLHYCQETEINGYVVCNGPDCVLCRIGRTPREKLLLPVYLPATGRVGILPVDPSLRPFALLPQIANVLQAEKRMVMFVRRDGAKYTVSVAELQEDVDDGAAVIRRFLDDYEAGLYDPLTAYPRIDNEQLAGVEVINQMLTLKGVRSVAGDKRF